MKIKVCKHDFLLFCANILHFYAFRKRLFYVITTIFKK
ncbi:hypothetical protein M128_0977 [Bacteroides fragilis str. S6L8]|uniref:Uncharacterized protein n=3 Tax=Bacteroides fragilis TaxID=817 RepID=A0A015UN22_BACFG|nr:hypothetical protein M101_0896 [Bacteroides fragilis str. 1007-1-F \